MAHSLLGQEVFVDLAQNTTHEYFQIMQYPAGQTFKIKFLAKHVFLRQNKERVQPTAGKNIFFFHWGRPV